MLCRVDKNKTLATGGLHRERDDVLSVSVLLIGLVICQ